VRLRGTFERVTVYSEQAPCESDCNSAMSSLMDATAEELDDLLQGKSFGNLLLLADAAGRSKRASVAEPPKLPTEPPMLVETDCSQSPVERPLAMKIME
jgi:hypothetical protein